MKAKSFSSFLRALLKRGLFTPAFFVPLFGSFSQSIWRSGPWERAHWFVFPPHVHLSKLILFPWSRWISKRRFLEWAAVLFLSLPPLDPKQSRFLFTHKWTLSKVHLKWDGHDRQQLSLQAWRDVHLLCHIAVVLVCGSELRFKTSRLLDKNNNRNKGSQSCMLLGAG